MKPFVSCKPYLAAVALAVGCVSTARAQDATPLGESPSAQAEALFKTARERMTMGFYQQACPMFAESYRLDPATGSLLALAVCQEREGRITSSHATYLLVAERARSTNDDARAAVAEAKAAELAPLRPTVTLLELEREDASPAAQIRVNGKPLSPEQRSAPLPVDGGPLLLEVSSPGKLAWSRTLQVPTASATLLVTLPPLVSVGAPTLAAASTGSHRRQEVPDLPAEPERSPLRVATIALSTTAGVALATGGIAALRAVIRNRSADIGCADGPCTANARSDRRAADRAGNAARAMVGVAAGLGLVALTTYLIERFDRDMPAPRALRAAPWVDRDGAGAIATASF